MKFWLWINKKKLYFCSPSIGPVVQWIPAFAKASADNGRRFPVEWSKKLGPIVQWIPAFAKASADNGRRFPVEWSKKLGPIVQWIERRFPKP